MEDFVFDLGDIINAAVDNAKEDVTEFEDIINLDSSLDRDVYVGDITESSGSSVDSLIRFWNRYDESKGIVPEERKPIKIYIDSYGGSLTDAFTIINTIKMSKTPVWTIITGCAYSAGYFIAIAGHRRIAYPLASFLYHEGSASNSGTASQFENYAQYYKRQLQQLKNHTLSCTKITEEEYLNMRKDDVWMDAEQALENGSIDEIAKELI